MRLYITYTHNSDYDVDNMELFQTFWDAKEFLRDKWENEKEEVGASQIVDDGTYFEEHSDIGCAWGRVETDYSFTYYEVKPMDI